MIGLVIGRRHRPLNKINWGSAAARGEGRELLEVQPVMPTPATSSHHQAKGENVKT